MVPGSFALLACLVACDVEEVPPLGGGPDGGTAALCANRGTVGQAHQHAGNVTHAGEGCITAGCHLAGDASGAPAFTAAGTVYRADGTTPNPGAVVRVVSGAMTLTGVADDAGNFRIAGAITFPAQTHTTACPDTTPMVGAIAQGGGNCNAAGCHAVGSTQGVIKFQ